MNCQVNYYERVIKIFLIDIGLLDYNNTTNNNNKMRGLKQKMLE